MKTVRNISNIEKLLDSIGAGVKDRSENGPGNEVTLNLWDGRKIIANYETNPSKIDAVTRDEQFWDLSEIRPLTEKLLAEGIPFVTQTGTHDTVCSLKWEIQK